MNIVQINLSPSSSVGNYRSPGFSSTIRGTTSFLLLVTLGLLTFSLGTGISSSACLRAAELKGTQLNQWRLIWKEDPATQATLSWSTAEAGKSHRVHLNVVDQKESQTIDCQRNGQYKKNNDDPDLFFHHARLTGLKPSTRYRVILESDAQRSPEMYFITAPADNRPLSILFGGDSRSGRQARQDMNRMMSRMLKERPSILALAHGGDFVARGTNLSQFSRWMTDHELTTTSDGRLLPIIPTRGNHDGGELFNQIFDFPDGDLNYYGTTLSPLARIVTLNSNISAAGDQADWLDAELARARPKHRWLLAQYHQPAYPAVKGPGRAKASWTPLFEKHNVDMACEADGHSIKRTVPIRGDQVDSTGVVYVGEGGLGVGQRPPKSDRWYLQPPGKSGMGHHLQLISFDEDKLTYRVILIGGKEFDRYVMRPRGAKAKKAQAASAAE